MRIQAPSCRWMYRTRICQTVAVALTAMVFGSATASPVDDLIKSEMAKMRIPGLSIAIIKDGEIVKLSGYGVANLETSTPATPDTVYKIASLSKQFIATAVMLLAEENKIRLDDRISRYL